MTRAGITYAQVAQAADALLLQEQNPTIEKVREELGGTGSFGTLSKHLNTWRSQRLLSAVKETPEKVITPDEVSQAVSHVWTQINDKAKQELERIKQEHDVKVGELLHQLQQCEAEQHDLRHKLETTTLALNHQQTDNVLIEKKLLKAQQQNHLLEEKLHTQHKWLTHYQQEMDKNVQQIKEISETQIIEIKSAFENTQETLADYKRLLEQQRTALMVKWDEEKTKKEKAEKQAMKYEYEVKQLTLNFDKLNESHAKLSLKYKLLQAEMNTKEKQQATINATLAHCQQQNEELKAKCFTLEDKLAMLINENALLKAVKIKKQKLK